jgi:hypothetical protein
MFYPRKSKHHSVMPGLVPGIHALLVGKNVDGRDKPGHDDPILQNY